MAKVSEEEVFKEEVYAEKKGRDTVVELVQPPKNTEALATKSVLADAKPEEGLVIDDEWFQLVGQLDIAGNTLNMARNCALETRSDWHFEFTLDIRHEALVNNERIQKLQNALAAHFNKAVTLAVQVSAPKQKTPDQWAEEIRLQNCEKATEILHADPVVQSLQQRFQAVIDPESITPKF